MLKIAITGNIASGKSLFETYLKAAGHKVLCLDMVTASFYENNNDFQTFLINRAGTFKKPEISKIAFENPSFRRELEGFLFPLIFAEMNKFFEENSAQAAVFVSAALLFEAGFDKYFDKIVFVSAAKEIRLQRLMARNSLTKSEALLRINSQAEEAQKAEKSDFVIKNEASKEDFEAAAQDFINNFLKKH